MLDIRFVRQHPDLVRENLRRRKDEEKLSWVDDVLVKDTQWRQLKGDTDRLRSERNKLSQEINERKKRGVDASEVLEQVRQIPLKIKEQEELMQVLETEIREVLMRMPNIMHESVPYGKDDTENVVVQVYGEMPHFEFAPKSHNDLIARHADLERAAKVSGARFYFLTGDLARLEFALQMYAIEFMASRGYTLTVPPHMLRRSAYEGVTSLADFEDTIYKIQDEDLYLIATSEHPLTAQFQDEVLESLPIKLVGVSPCYRKEAGSHGKDEKGIWRVHQFSKIEQIVICKPEESWQFHEEITKNAIDFFLSLGLHFHQVLICTGDLGIVAAKKFDLEAWIPSVQQYKEVVSSSNCTSYQAVRLNMKYREDNENKYVHTLNSTCVATTRAMVAILEQFQQADGSVVVPEPLRKYVGKDRILH